MPWPSPEVFRVSAQALTTVQQRDGKLKLMHFRRVKQLGAGDVGLVDLVQLQVSGWLGDECWQELAAG